MATMTTHPLCRIVPLLLLMHWQCPPHPLRGGGLHERPVSFARLRRCHRWRPWKAAAPPRPMLHRVAGTLLVARRRPLPIWVHGGPRNPRPPYPPFGTHDHKAWLHALLLVTLALQRRRSVSPATSGAHAAAWRSRHAALGSGRRAWGATAPAALPAQARPLPAARPLPW